jgi:Leucine-rich repeat (LRR) protein
LSVFCLKKMVQVIVEEAIAQMRRGVADLKPYGMLWGKRLGDGDARALAAELATLTELNLGNNSIGAAGAASLADALVVNSTVAQLDLTANSIGDAGAASLAEVLRVNTTLTELYLSQNSIGAEGAASLAEALGVNTTLMGLNLGVNSIGDAGAASLADAIRANTALRGLNLGDNRISDAGASSLEAAVTSNPFALVPITPAQRLAFFTGHLRRPAQKSPLARLPLDVVRRILTRYTVAQGRREWMGGGMMSACGIGN